MEIPFFKYQGTGNDFVIVDEFDRPYVDMDDQESIARICHRKFGVGADGLILLRPAEDYDFEMVYFNADGRPGSLCGNGGRCAVACMHQLERIQSATHFVAADGAHQARIVRPDFVELRMNDVTALEEGKGFYVLDTGSPHYVSFVEDLSDLDIVESGRAIRYSSRFAASGINVNFVEVQGEDLRVQTYERGVEDETLSCGTGVTATAIADAYRKGTESGETLIKTKGGDLMVKYRKTADGFSDLWLCGAATLVFQGQISI